MTFRDALPVHNTETLTYNHVPGSSWWFGLGPVVWGDFTIGVMVLVGPHQFLLHRNVTALTEAEKSCRCREKPC